MNPEIFIPISFFASVVLVVYFVMRSRTKERLALIEKGGVLPSLKSNDSPNSALKSGLFLTGLSLGFFVGLWISYAMGIEKNSAVFLVGSLSLLFAGLGLILFYIIENQKAKQ